MESKQQIAFDPKQYMKQNTTTFANNNINDYDMDGDDLEDDYHVQFTPSAQTEGSTMLRQNTGQSKNEYDLDMDDTEETKEELTNIQVTVPVEQHFRSASKSLTVDQIDGETGEANQQNFEMVYTNQNGEHSMQRRQSDQAGAEPIDVASLLSKRALASRQASFDTHIDISAIDDEARRLSWQRLMEQNLETISEEQFDSNMRRLSDLEEERRLSSAKASFLSGQSQLSRKPTIKKTSITVVIADMDYDEQVKIEHPLELIVKDGVEGYDLGALIDIAMDVYDLDPQFGIQIDYWSNSMQTYNICDNIFSHRQSLVSSHSGHTQNSNVSQMNVKHIIAEEDLTYNNEGKPCLGLRFKNCTGNIIELEDKHHIVTEIEFAQAQIALSYDSQFKNQRNRTVTQAIDMVLRQRTISMGYYDFQIRRYVKPMTLEQAAKNLDLRHRMLTNEDQHIEKKTLDDYYAHIRIGNDSKNPYNFSANQDELVKCLRKHCQETKEMH